MTKATRILIVVVFAPVALYYLWTHGFVYFNFKREVYTDYFWYRAPWLFGHVVLGITATLTGSLQMVPVIRKRHPALHRNLGRIYFGCVGVSTLISFHLVAGSQLGIVYNTGLTMLGVSWLLTTAMGFFAARVGNVGMHREWMIKSYVLTLSFVTFRLVEDLLVKAGVGNFSERKVLMAWACWAIPLFITEFILQIRRLNVFNQGYDKRYQSGYHWDRNRSSGGR